MAFKPSSDLTYQSGDLFIGRDGRRDIGVKTDRHAITIAGSRSGKGACVIIPNLLRWPHNALVIDPKGENAEKTYDARLKMGQSIHVIDPYEEAKEVPKQLRGAFNPLGEIDKDSLTASTDLEVIADGLVKRADPKHAQWDDGAVSILAGVMAFILADAPPEKRNLMALREVLVQTDEDLRADAVAMMEVEEFDGLARAAGVSIITALDNPKTMEGDFLGGAKRHTKWLDKRAMRNVLEKSTFSLSDLKTGDASVYLVLPPDYLDNDGAFLRLFVRCALSAMARGGSGKGKRCLFILDEFFSLGKMDVIQKSAGSMPSYGVHLWPFLQDLGQLLITYDSKGAETFFANADLHQFFGNFDPLTLEHVSMRFGSKTADEVRMPNAPSAPISSGASMGRGIASLGGYSKNTYTRGTAGVLGGLLAAGEGAVQSARQSDYNDRLQHYQQEMQRAMAQVGAPRVPPDQVGRLIQQKPDKVAPNIINFVAGEQPVIVTPAPYFVKDTQPSAPARPRLKLSWLNWVSLYLALGILIEEVMGGVWLNMRVSNTDISPLRMGEFSRPAAWLSHLLNPHPSSELYYLVNEPPIFLLCQITFVALMLGSLYWGYVKKRHFTSWAVTFGGMMIAATIIQQIFALSLGVTTKLNILVFNPIDLMFWPARLVSVIL